jgi:3-phenylpropionate/trans-cinnamate dioxygenase ferredoxin reductase component
MRYQNVIVGAGWGGGNAAKAYREAGGDGSLLLVGTEAHPPYQRPPLTKGFLRGEESVESTYVEPGPWWPEHGIELRTDTEVRAIDADAHEIVLADGERVGYERLALATGAAPRPLHGAQLIRTIEDSEEVRALVARGHGRLAVIGGGFIGIEAAASARMKGLDVTLVMRNRVVWDHLFGAEVGGYFQRQLEAHGVEVLAGQDIVAWDGATLTTSGGQRVTAEHAVAGIGVAPRIELAREAGLETGSGVLVNEYLSAGQDIWAIGDMAEYQSVIHGRRIRVEHWDVALNHGLYLGRTWAGAESGPYDVVPYFFSDLADWTWMEYVGPGSGRAELRGSMEDDDFVAYYVGDAGEVTACLGVNRSDDVEAAKELIRTRKPPPAA